jgi:protein-disulfide isomerase
MKNLSIALLACAAALSLSACDKDRKAVADTGTAKAEVTTEAPKELVPDQQLQQQAQQAATAASTPVDGSGPVPGTNPDPIPKK